MLCVNGNGGHFYSPNFHLHRNSVVHELKSKLKLGCVPVFSMDGLAHYFYALTAYFGEWAQVEGEKKPVWLVLSNFFYAQVIKYRRRFRLVVELLSLLGLS